MADIRPGHEVDIQRVAGTAADSNTGNASAGTIRVVLASDQPVIPISDNAGSLTVDGTVAVSSITTSVTPGTAAGNLGKAEDAAHTSGDVGVMALAVRNDNAATTIAGTTGDYSPVAVDSLGRQYVTGGIAHDAVDSGGPVKVGMKAVALKATPTAVAAADRTDWIAQRNGVPYTIGGHPNVVAFEYNTTAAQTNDAIIPSIASGTAIVLTSIEATVDNATSVDVGLRVGFGTSTLTAEGASGADAVQNIVLSHPGVAAGSGITKGNGGGIIGIGASDAELRVTNEVPTDGKLRITGTYYTASI